jgi:GT2 family glycosyltransferase
MDTATQQIRISFCVTSYNRPVMTIRSFIDILDDERVGEVIVCDDSEDGSELLQKISELKSEKIIVIKNHTKLGCFRNKREVISHASNDWVIIADSDNIFKKDYLDKIYQYGWWNEKVVYAPDFARPNFNYQDFDNVIITRKNVHKLIDKPSFDALLNTFNYFVNKNEYLRVWKAAEDPHAIDSIYHNTNWLEAGNMILVVPNLQYEHTVHNGSLYLELANKTHGLHKKLKNKLKLMR